MLVFLCLLSVLHFFFFGLLGCDGDQSIFPFGGCCSYLYRVAGLCRIPPNILSISFSRKYPYVGISMSVVGSPLFFFGLLGCDGDQSIFPFGGCCSYLSHSTE